MTERQGAGGERAADTGRSATPEARSGSAVSRSNAATIAFRQLAAAAKAHGLGEDFAEIAEIVRRAQGAAPSVVVVGEMNRGKSTLVNGLLGIPGAAPSGPTETTALAVNYEQAGRLEQGQAELEFANEPWRRLVPASELPEWVRLDSPRLIAAEEAPLQATLAVPPGLVAGATIVDTPGAGGLSEAYALRALSRAQEASVLLVVTDASGRLTAPAVDFLDRCAAKVDAVVIAMSKIDLYRPSWEQVAEDNRRVLAEHGPRLGRIPIVGVSGAWAERAAAEPDPARRARLLEASRLPALVEHLSIPLERAARLPTRNALRQGCALLAPILSRLQAERAANADIGDADQLRRLRDRRAQLREQIDDAKYGWNAEVDRVRAALTTENSRRTREFSAQWRERVTGRAMGLSKAQAVVLQNELAAAVEVEATEAAGRIITAGVRLLEDLYGSVGMRPRPGVIVELERRARQLAGPSQTVERQAAPLDPRMLLSSGIMGIGIGNIALGTLIGVAAPLVGVAVMAGLGSVLMKRQATRQSIVQVVQETALELREQLDRVVRSMLSVVVSDGRKHFDRDLRQALSSTSSELERAERAARASTAERTQRRNELTPQIDAISLAIHDAEREVDRLSA